MNELFLNVPNGMHTRASPEPFPPLPTEHRLHLNGDNGEQHSSSVPCSLAFSPGEITRSLSLPPSLFRERLR